MKGKKEFGDGILYTISNYIYLFIVLNFNFIFSNLPFIIFIMFLKPVFENVILYFLGILFLGPSFSALLSCIIKYIEKDEINPTKDYWYYYKSNYKDSLCFWVPFCFLLLILSIDIKYFQLSSFKYKMLFNFFFLFLMTALYVLIININIINVKFKFRKIDVIRLGIYYSLYKFKTSICNIILLISAIIAMNVISNFLILFVSSLICYFIVKNTYPIIENISKRFI